MSNPEKLRIRVLQEALHAPVARFIQSWGREDVYKRFGWFSPESQRRLTSELTKRLRPAFVAFHDGGVVGLLDFAYAEGAIHVGLVVDPKYRRSSIGTLLLRALLQSKGPAHPVLAECSADNIPAVALLRKCRFRCTRIESSEMTWSYGS